MESAHVTFVERGGDGAREALRRLRDRLTAAGTPARLLASRDDPSTYLLVIEGDPAGDLALEAPGARTWRFRDERSAGRP